MGKKYRDAETGKYVSKEYAEKHPKTTVGETARKPNKPKKRK
ncbi:multidrug transporter [Legionella israelensis]|nr:multidrug transporter [Legionella israelensis]QDP72720.1 multidrug transporter [Legionella israelensis]